MPSNISGQWKPLVLFFLPDGPNRYGRFSALVGRSPLRYQNEWRLTLAKTMLAKHNSRIGEVGFAIGYESEASFSRAYKAYFGRSPRDDNSQGGA